MSERLSLDVEESVRMQEMSSKVLSFLVGMYVRAFSRVSVSHGLLGRAEEINQQRELGRADVPFSRKGVGTVLHPSQLSNRK